MVLQVENNWRLSFATYPNAALYIPEGSDEIFFRTTSRKKKKSKEEISKLGNTIQFSATDNNNNEIHVKTEFADANTKDCFTNNYLYENKFNIKLKKAGEKQKQTKFQMRIKSNNGEHILTRYFIAHEFYMETKYKVQTRQLKNIHSINIPVELVSDYSSIIVEFFYDTHDLQDKTSPVSFQNQNHYSPINNIIPSSNETSEQNNHQSGENENDYDFNLPFSPNTYKKIVEKCFVTEPDGRSNEVPNFDTSNESGERLLTYLIDFTSDSNNQFQSQFESANDGDSYNLNSMEQIEEVVDVVNPPYSHESGNDPSIQDPNIHHKENETIIENKKNDKVNTEIPVEIPVTPHRNTPGLSSDDLKRVINIKSVSIHNTSSSSTSSSSDSKKRKSENEDGNNNDNENNSPKKRKIEEEGNKEVGDGSRFRKIEMLTNHITQLTDTELNSLYYFIFKKENIVF